VRTTTLWLTALSIALGFIAAYAALHGAGDVLVYLLVLMFGGLLGYLGPRVPWRWGLVLGIWVPIALGVDRLTDPIGPQPMFRILQPLLALVPAFVGVYAGVLVRRLLPPPRPPQPS
jgi:hypothetical protein